MPNETGLNPAPGVTLRRNVRVPMRDGALLAADIYLPSAPLPAGGLPVVMELLPYRKDENTGSASFWSRLPREGYVFARVDVRGTGDSEGVSTDEYVPQEQEDGYDLIEWLAAQSFCDGHVNMIGISYGGFNSLQIATMQPPHLSSIIPIDFTDDRYSDDCHFRGGSLRGFYDVTEYGTMMVAWNALPPFKELLEEDWARVWNEHLEHNTPYMLRWLEHQSDGAYWRHGSVGDVADKIRCPVFMIGGWRDGYPNPPLRLYEKLRVPKKVIVGPWNHDLPDNAVPGPRIDYLREVVRWLDHWCKGHDTGIVDEPPVMLFVQRPTSVDPDRLETQGSWRAELDWPVPRESLELFLAAENRLAGQAGEEGSDGFEYVATVGTTGGLWSGGSPFGLPGDQRPDEALSLVFTGAPLTEDLYVVGRPRMVLHASSTAAVAAFALSLASVAPDGSSELVCKGYLNATRRESTAEPAPLLPDEVYELEIDLDTTAWCFPKDHRIRLAIAGSDWPNVWPTPTPVINTVLHGSSHPSRLILPAAPERGSAEPPEFKPSGSRVERHRDSLDPPSWVVEDDVLTGVRSVRTRVSYRTRLDDSTVVERVAGGRAQVHPRLPARASITGFHTTRLVSDGTEIVASAETVLSSTANAFHVSITLAVSTNGRTFFERRWTESYERLLM